MFDQPLPDTFITTELRMGDLDRLGRYTDKYGSPDGATVFRLHDHRARPLATDLLTVHHETRAGNLRIQHGVDTIGLDVEIVGNGHSCYALGAVLAGKMSVTGGPQKPAMALGTTGFVVRTLPETQFLIEDGSERVGAWMDAGRLERTLQTWLGEPLREMLAFSPGADWASGPGRAVWRMMLHFMEELRDPEGLLIEPVARETFTDLFMQTVLRRLPHNYTARLERSADTVVPRHVRRAEAFMRAFADQPITMPDVAAAAGCGTATLYASFRRFRGHDAARHAAQNTAGAGTGGIDEHGLWRLHRQHRAPLRIYKSFPFHCCIRKNFR